MKINERGTKTSGQTRSRNKTESTGRPSAPAVPPKVDRVRVTTPQSVSTLDRDPGAVASSPLASREVLQRQSEAARLLTGQRPGGGEVNFDIPIKSSGISEPDDDQYVVPVDGENSRIRSQETRSDQLIAEQEANVQSAIESGEAVTFVNAQGEAEQISVVQGDDGRYVVRGEDGHELGVNLDELQEQERINALTNITNYYSEVPEHLRESVAQINVQDEPAEFGAAFYRPEERSLTFGDGLRFLDEHTFNHEFGHGIAYHVANQQDSSLENFREIFSGERNAGIPDGWEQAAGGGQAQVTDYAGTDPRESFAESWLFYVDARQRGPEALAEFEEVYPNQVALLESIYDGSY